MFDTVLVADRGLTACRVVRTCQRLGVRALTVHVADDADRLHSACADESLLLGASEPAVAYLDGLKVIEAAGQGGAQAVHPGSGPLARSAAFATAVGDAGLAWVGPAPEVLAAAERAAAAPSDLVVTVLADADGPVVVGETARSGGRWASPAALPDDLRARMRSAALEAAASAGLVGLAGVAVRPDGAAGALRPWLGVDHAVLELVTGVDLVEQQLRTAAGRSAGVEHVDAPGGAGAMVALRARTAGRLAAWRLPEGEDLRVEVGCREGEDVAPGDGPLLTVAAWAPTGEQAQERLAAACASLVVDGIELEEDPHDRQ